MNDRRLVIACTPSGGIGLNNKLPWGHLPGDLPNFKKYTTGLPVVMGRKTWDSLPLRPLPNRTNFVLTKGAHDFGVSMEHLATMSEYAVIGGAGVVELLFDNINSVYLTEVKREYKCDVFIDIDRIKREFMFIETLDETGDFVLNYYWRKL